MQYFVKHEVSIHLQTQIRFTFKRMHGRHDLCALRSRCHDTKDSGLCKLPYVAQTTASVSWYPDPVAIRSIICSMLGDDLQSSDVGLRRKYQNQPRYQDKKQGQDAHLACTIGPMLGLQQPRQLISRQHFLCTTPNGVCACTFELLNNAAHSQAGASDHLIKINISATWAAAAC